MFRICPERMDIELVENNSIQKCYQYVKQCLVVTCSFSEVCGETKKHRQFIDNQISQWTTDLMKGISSLVIVSGTIDGGKNYLLKGSNSVPGLIPSLQRRMIQWLGTLKVLANFSHLRYANGILIYLRI